MTAYIRIVDIQNDNPAKCFEPLGALANAVAEIIAAKGNCTPFDLIRQHYRPMLVFKNWPAAYQLGKSALRSASDDNLLFAPPIKKEVPQLNKA